MGLSAAACCVFHALVNTFGRCVAPRSQPGRVFTIGDWGSQLGAIGNHGTAGCALGIEHLSRRHHAATGKSIPETPPVRARALLKFASMPVGDVVQEELCDGIELESSAQVKIWLAA